MSNVLINISSLFFYYTKYLRTMTLHWVNKNKIFICVTIILLIYKHFSGIFAHQMSDSKFQFGFQVFFMFFVDFDNCLTLRLLSIVLRILTDLWMFRHIFVGLKILQPLISVLVGWRPYSIIIQHLSDTSVRLFLLSSCKTRLPRILAKILTPLCWNW